MSKLDQAFAQVAFQYDRVLGRYAEIKRHAVSVHTLPGIREKGQQAVTEVTITSCQVVNRVKRPMPSLFNARGELRASGCLPSFNWNKELDDAKQVNSKLAIASINAHSIKALRLSLNGNALDYGHDRFVSVQHLKNISGPLFTVVEKENPHKAEVKAWLNAYHEAQNLKKVTMGERKRKNTGRLAKLMTKYS